MVSAKFARSLMFTMLFAVSVLATVGPPRPPVPPFAPRHLQLVCEVDGAVLGVVAPWRDSESRAEAETYARAYVAAQWPSARLSDVYEVIEEPRAPSDGE